MQGSLVIAPKTDTASPLTIRRSAQSTNLSIAFEQKDFTRYLGISNGELKFGTTADVNSSGHYIYHEGKKPTSTEIGAVSKTGDTINGILTINSSAEAQIRLKATTNEKSNYILGQNPDGSSSFFIGKSSTGIAIHSYDYANSLTLKNDRVEAKKNLYVEKNLVYHTGNINTYCPHRVGDIIDTENAEHPATTWPGTQWERYGNGKVIVGLSESENEFNSVGKTGGTKTEALTEAQNGPHTHKTGQASTSFVGGGSQIPLSNVNHGGSYTTSSSGQGAPHNNLQPYVVAYRWKRTV